MFDEQLKRHELNLKREIERINKEIKELEQKLTSLRGLKKVIQAFCEHRLMMPVPDAEGKGVKYECLICGLVGRRGPRAIRRQTDDRAK